jgi:hypothetical protein
MKRVLITPQHFPQYQIFTAPQRNVIAVCGRRFGKTAAAIERALRKMRRRKLRGWIIAPTRDMVKDLFWETLKERADRLHWKVKTNENDLTIERLSTGARYRLLSGEKPERKRGRGLDDVIIDEAADMDASLWPEVIRPALIDRKGTALIQGTPAGRNHFYELWNSTAGDPTWGRFQFKTIDNPYLPRDEIEHLRATLDDRTFRQELEADFVEYLGAAYSYHDPDVHRKEYPFNPNREIMVCCDFNIDPCIWELGQPLDVPIDIEYIFDEICQRNTTIWRMCAEVKRRIVGLYAGNDQAAREHRLVFYGDFTSAKRRDVSAGNSSWQIIRQEFEQWNATFNLKQNPRVVDRLNAMNGAMRSSDGKVHFAYSKRAIELNKDFDMCSGDDVLKKAVVGDRTHASDGVGYMMDWKRPIMQSFAQQFAD